MMNSQITFFVIISIVRGFNQELFFAHENVDLSENTQQKLRKLCPDETNRNEVEKLLKEEKKKNKQLEEKFLPFMFFCAIITAKGDIDLAKNVYDIFKPIINLSKRDKNLEKSFEFPSHLGQLMLNHDGHVSENIQEFVNEKISQYRNLYFRLMRYDKSDFFDSLRTELKTEFGDANITDVYRNFSATITRDYAFFNELHRDTSSTLLLRIKYSPSKNFLQHLFELNSGWYLTNSHIKHINILRKVCFGENISEIVGYSCRNGFGQLIEIPLYDDCGHEEGFTLSYKKT